MLRLEPRGMMRGPAGGRHEVDAKVLCAQIRQDLGDVEKRIKTNSWLAALETGRLPVGALQSFAGEQFEIIPSDLRSFEMLSQRFPDDPAHGYLIGMVAGERAALSALDAFAAAVDLNDAARQRYEPVPGCQVYPSYVARLASDGTPAQIAGAFLVNLDAWGSCCARMANALPPN